MGILLPNFLLKVLFSNFTDNTDFDLCIHLISKIISKNSGFVLISN